LTSVDEGWRRTELAVDASLAELGILLWLLGSIGVDPCDLEEYAHVDDSRTVTDFDSSGRIRPRGETKQAIKHSSGHSKHSGGTSKGKVACGNVFLQGIGEQTSDGLWIGKSLAVRSRCLTCIPMVIESVGMTRNARSARSSPCR